MAELSKDVLSNFKEKIRRSKHLADQSSGITLLVLALNRYSIDPTFASQTGLTSELSSEAYDVLLSDQKQKIKCLLDPVLNHLVRKNKLQAGSLVSIKLSGCSVRYNELDITAASFVIIHNVEIQRKYTGIIDNRAVPFCRLGTCAENETSDQPLVTSRGSYLSLWNSEDPCGCYWENRVPVVSQLDFDSTIRLAKLANQWPQLKKPYPPLLLRVLHRSRLKYSSKPHKKEKWPFQLYIEAADSSGSCTGIFWSALCLEVFNSVVEGSVLLISNYNVRGRFQLMSRAKVRNRQLQLFDIEVNLNKSSVLEVKVVDPGIIKSEWNLPEITYSFFYRKEMSSLPDQYNIDLAGIVCYVGRYERASKSSDRSDHEYLLYRWIHLMDRSSSQPIRVLLYATSQPQDHASIRPGKIVVFTQMKLVHDVADIQSSCASRHLYATTTNESQIYVHSLYGRGPCQHPRIRHLAQWGTSQAGTQAVENIFSVGGYYSYPALPISFADYTANMSDQIKLFSGDHLAVELRKLSYLEHCRLSMQGFVLNVQYHPVHSSEEEDPFSAVDLPDIVGEAHRSKNNHHKNKRRKTNSVSYDANAAAEYVVDDIWPDISERVPSLGMSHPCPHFYRRKCTGKQAEDVLKNLFAMPSNTYTVRAGPSPIPIEDLPVVGHAGCVTVSVVGLNFQGVIHTLLPIPQSLAPDITLEDILCGRCEDITEDTDRIQVKTTVELMSEVLQTGAKLCQCRMLFILDVYCLGEEKLEIVLNRGYQLDGR